MVLTALRGGRRAADRKALLFAISRAPALVIDCANGADPRALFPALSQERLDCVHLLGVDRPSGLRDALLAVREFAGERGISTVAVTSVGSLLGSPDGNRDILAHCRELLDELATDFDIAVAEGGAWAALPRAGCGAPA